MTISKKLKLLIISLFLIVSIILIYTYSSVSNIIKNKSVAFADEYMVQIENYIYRYFTDAKNIADSIAYNSSVQNFINAKNMDQAINSEIVLRSYIRNIKNSNNIVGEIGITSYINGYNYGQYSKFIDSPPNFAKGQIYTGLQDNGLLYILQPVYDTESKHSTFEKIGYISIGIKTENIESIFEQLKPTTNTLFFFLDNDNKTITQNILAKNKNIENLMDDNKYITHQKNVKDLNFYIYYFIPKADYTTEIRNALSFNIPIAILLLVIAFVVSKKIANNITGAITEISLFSNMVGKGNIKERLTYNPKNELSAVVDCINLMLDNNEKMTRRIFATQESLYTAELDKKQYQLNFLQNQINPHFMYNTLECIRSIADIKDVPEISTISVSMAKILRYSINSSDAVPLSSELVMLKNYFDIISIRYMNRYNLQINCDENCADAYVIKMILQPIVENSIKHGFSGKKDNCFITVNCALSADILVISIEDTGVTLSHEKLSQLNEILSNAPAENSSSIGLHNINSRIKNYYGADFGIEVLSNAVGGTTVIAKIPYRKGGNL